MKKYETPEAELLMVTYSDVIMVSVDVEETEED